ncbi:MAG: DUF1553 domain-containing protein [Verrucomicrobiaceae bacterium]|nr:DUF1553 domain-containing protein [Verrucomicrobiaceae bacterium]
MSQPISSFTLSLLLFVAGAALSVFAEVGTPIKAAKPDFNRDIRPILSETCFACHGMDAKAREGDLRLDVREEAIKGGALVPGNLDKSTMWKHITTDDPKEIMPPPKSKKVLSESQKAKIKAWIESGAEYADHWAFIPAQKPTIPAESEPGQTAIDPFVRRKLREAGLSPSPPASKAAWLRRVTFDLTGVAPTFDEMSAFEADSSPLAQHRVVDRLLGSPLFGEHMAVDWLDVARYADTYGRHEDGDCVSWPYRNWTIDAINRNLPYDQFITEQTAGDLLPDPTEDQLIATAFNRLAQQSNEAGSDPEEFRIEQVADRVKTNGIAFLGLSLECARCHDHKYDPVSMKDFYSMAAYLNNIDELGLFGVYVGASTPPAIPLYTPEQKAERAKVLDRIKELEGKLAAERESARTRFISWLEANEPPFRRENGFMAKMAAWFLTPPKRAESRKPLADYRFEQVKDKHTANSALPGVEGQFRNKVSLVPGRIGKAAHMEGDNSALLTGIPEIKRTDAFTLAGWLQPKESFKRATVFHRTRAGLDAGCRGVEVLLDEDRPSFALVHYNPGHEIRVRAKRKLPINQWSHLAVTYDGSSKASGLKIYIDGEQVETDVIRDHLYRDVVYRSDWGDDTGKDDGKELGFRIGARTNDSSYKNGYVDEVTFHDAALSVQEIRQLALKEDTSTAEDWFEWYVREQDSPSMKIAAELKAARDEENVISGEATDFMVMKELQGPRRPTHMLRRGEFNQPTEEVQPGVPERFLKMPNGAPNNRLGLAKWLVDKQNPLTSRVAVNRIWQHFFGRGIVPTAEDFGTQGQPPSHPELLDYLATRFMEKGWDVKGLVRLIVLSATYGQATGTPPPTDAANVLLSCAKPTRLNAEQVRDHALAASGLLVKRFGGPSVKPYQPVGLWEEAGTQHIYHQDQGEKLFRRSIYTFWRRTLPPPTMTIFDAPTREYCKPRRDRTATPLQSLVLMNDPQFIEAARYLASNLLKKHSAQPIAWAEEAWRLFVSDRPSQAQLETLTAYYNDELAAFAADRKETELFLTSSGTLKPANDERSPELAAATLTIRMIMNYADATMK